MAFVLIATPSSGTSIVGSTTTAQTIINRVSQDIRSVLGTSGSDQTILLDYVNRIHKEVLRESNWEFLKSAPQRFVTELGVNNYWLGTTGSNTLGAQDTGLNLSDIRRIDERSVLDLSNATQLSKEPERPMFYSFIQQDGSSRTNRPTSWTWNREAPYLLNLFPAPDNQNTYQPVPLSPVCQTSTTGALAARTYFVKVTFVDSAGNESMPSPAARTYVPANKVLVVKAPQPYVSGGTSGITYSNYKVYVGTVENAETLQSTSTAIAADWTEPGTGLVAGAALPTVNNIEPLRGYVIEFRYFRTRTEISIPAQVLQVPDDYSDIITAGVNYLAYQFLKRPTEAKDWYSIYKGGIKEMIKDMNLHPHNDFIRPAS